MLHGSVKLAPTFAERLQVLGTCSIHLPGSRSSAVCHRKGLQRPLSRPDGSVLDSFPPLPTVAFARLQHGRNESFRKRPSQSTIWLHGHGYPLWPSCLGHIHQPHFETMCVRPNIVSLPSRGYVLILPSQDHRVGCRLFPLQLDESCLPLEQSGMSELCPFPCLWI